MAIGVVAAGDDEVVIVLDDWHLADGPEAMALLRRLVDRLPPFAHLVIVTLGTALWITGAVLLLGSNTGFEMLSLSRGYAAADPAGQATYLAAAQGMLASYWDMGTSFVFGYVVSAIGGILVGAAMVRVSLFGRATGLMLVAGSVISLGIFIPGPGVVLALGSVVVVWFWYLRTGWALLRVVRPGAPAVVPGADRPVRVGTAA